MVPKTPASCYAPAERAIRSEVARQARLLAQTPHLHQFYDSVTDAVFVLNVQRQVIFANRRVADLLGLQDSSQVHGLRPGEALGCHNACRTAGGCGTTEFCAACGAINAILSSQAGREDARECNIMRGDGRDALELLVRTTPLELAGERFTVLAASDISHEKRRRALERAFFHDLMNTAMGLKLYTRGLSKTTAEQALKLVGRIGAGVERLLAEIEEQRDLVMAENNDLAARPGVIRSRRFLEDLAEHYGQYAELHHCPLQVDASAEAFDLNTDPTLLSRVLGNMIKNALEASDDRPVTIGCRRTADGLAQFWVHNHGVMPRQVQFQVFQRSFTTKGEGRGLGTYSMKLLSERYLHGSVAFTSTPEHGTTFTATYPTALNAG